MAVSAQREIPDPHHKISSIRAKLPRKCRARKSKFCDHIIALRLQGNSFTKISDWLLEQGEEHYISATALTQTFHKVQGELNIPYAEELAERYGGEVDFDAVHELKRLALLQRTRVDRLARQEEKDAEAKPGFYNYRLRHEVNTLALLIKQFQESMKNPLEAANERATAEALTRVVDDSLVNEKLVKLIEDKILDGSFTDDDMSILYETTE